MDRGRRGVLRFCHCGRDRWLAVIPTGTEEVVMSIRFSSALFLASICLAAVPMDTRAGDALELYLGGGASGTSVSSFRGGAGAVIGVELPVASSANVLIRADYHSVPEQGGDGGIIVPWASTSWFGNWPGGARPMKAMSVLVGLRLHAPPGRVRTYVDALVGVGHARVDEPDLSVWAAAPGIMPPMAKTTWHETNVALSFGAGMKVRSPGPGSLFLDAHFDFYFLRDLEGAVVPIRLGYGVPFGRRGAV
jgi:hypothetical protein